MTRNFIVALVALSIASGCAMGAADSAAGLEEAPYADQGATVAAVHYDRIEYFNEVTREAEMLEVTALQGPDGRIESIELVLSTANDDYGYTLALLPNVEITDVEARDEMMGRIPANIAARFENLYRRSYASASVDSGDFPTVVSPGAEVTDQELAVRYAFHQEFAASREAQGEEVEPFAPGCNLDDSSELSSEQLQSLRDCIAAAQ